MTTKMMGMVVALAAGSALAATSVKAPSFDKHGNPTPLDTVFKPTPIEKRLEMIKPVAEGELRVRPLFNGCSVVWGASAEVAGLALEYRAKGAADWLKAPPIPYFENCKNYRGSILNLKESTDYDFRLVAGGQTRAEGSFRTWSTVVPIAKTIEIDPATATWPMKIAEKGSAEGWIRYTTKPGVVLDTKGAAAFLLDGAQYVLFDDMILRGGRVQNMIKITNSNGVRVRHCEIFDWGRDGKHDYARKGHLYEIKNPRAQINFDGAICIDRGSSEVVVERCYIHDAHSRSTSWYYAHPSGPEAVTMCCPDRSTVLRWNDFVGSDIHPWNDAVEGSGNFSDDGGFNRDAEVYGNFMIFSNDDSIELDGGMQNVRCYGNRFEASGCGVSIQGCMVSPVYVYDNLFTGLGEEHHLVMQTIKTSSFDFWGNGSWAWLADNTFWGEGTGVGVYPGSKYPRGLVARYNVLNNRFSGKLQKLGGFQKMPYRVDEGNTFEDEPFPETELDGNYPKRPLRFTLDRVRISLAEPFAPQVVTATSKSEKPIPFRIRINEDFDWFKVSPAEGIIPPKGTVKLIVTFDAAKMKTYHRYRGAFLVQNLHGLSRPVSLWCTTKVVPPYRAEKPGETAIYAAECKEGEFIRADETWRTYDFDIPKDGIWYFLIHGYSDKIGTELYTNNRQVLSVQVDDQEEAKSLQQVRNYPIWTLLMPGKNFGNFACPFTLKAGKHTVKIRCGTPASVVLYDGVVATDSCGAFEPK